MVKQRFGTADVAAEVACLKAKIIGMRVANIYDITPKTYVLKLARSGEEGEKVLLLIESGIRFHTVQAMPPKSDTPSNFSLKLRKHIRTRRVESIRQLGVDRIVDITFGSGEGACHLLLEFYAQGNVVLTDSKYEVLSLLRSHRDDAKGFAIMPRHPYPLHTVRLRQALDPGALEGALAAAPAGATLKSVLNDLLPYGPLVAEHCILSAGLDSNRAVGTPGPAPAAAAPAMPGGGGAAGQAAAAAVIGAGAAAGQGQGAQAGGSPLTPEEVKALLGGVRGWERWLDDWESKPPEGHLYIKPGKEGGDPTFEDFEPAAFAQHAGREALPVFPTFDAALDKFFSKIYGQRTVQQAVQKEKAVVGKLDAIKQDHARRLAALQQESEAAEVKARLIEYNLVAVDAALDSVREAVAAGMDWRDLARMIKEERRAGNPVAGLIDSLQLDRNRVTLLLSNWLDEEEEDEEAATRPATKVEVDLGLSAHSNARVYYDSRRKHQTKQAKTLGANQKALKAAEKKAQQQLKQVRSAPVAVPARKPYWFEKFHWFISSENYLVLSGRDAQQNELLVKRYMRAGDVYVHADLHGASTTLVKNHLPSQPVPPLTLSQAGQACVCRSAAWNAKVVTSAWWVYPEQVSKTAPSGEYLTTGSFMIRGKKNYLPPQPLVMGFGFLFRLEDSCIAAHLGERAPRLLGGEEEAAGSAAGAVAEAAVLEEDEEEEGEVKVAGEGESGGESGSEAGGGESEGDGEEGGASALDAFLDASADTLGSSGQRRQQQQQQQQLGRGGSGSGSGGQRRGSGGQGSSAGASAVGALASAFQRYGLEDHLPSGGPGGVEVEEEEGAAAAQQQRQQGGGKRHLSTKERQLLKKGAKGGAAAGGEQASAPGTSGTGGGAPAKHGQGGQAGTGQAGQGQKGKQAAQQAQQAQQQQQAVRGKAGKDKKAKQKYQDQDEEERELAARVLQSAGQKKDRKERKAERKHRMAARKAEKSGVPTQEITPEALAALAARPITDAAEGSGAEEEGEVEREAGEHEEGGNASSGGSEAAPGEEEEAAEAAADEAAGSGDEGGAEAGEAGGREASGPSAEPSAGAVEGQAGADAEDGEEEEDLGGEGGQGKGSQLDALTGCPRAEDILLFALPVCAPYQVMASYKFKVKLVPGTLKKGKAVRQATEILSRAAEGTQREKDLIKAVPEQDGITALMGTVKLQMPGLTKIKQGQKKKK